MRNSVGLIVIIGAAIVATLPWVVKDQFYGDGAGNEGEAAEKRAWSFSISQLIPKKPRANSTSARAREVAVRVRPILDTKLTALDLEYGAPVFIRIFKEESQLELWVKRGVVAPEQDPWFLFKTYKICAWSGKLGPKLKEGDRQSPEGFYYVTPGRMNPKSSYHLSFDLGYPNDYDQAHGRTGSYLMVHGRCASIGCYAMTDEGIEEIYTLADAAFSGGQKFFRVHVFPFRMTDERMDREFDQEARWIDFWKNLKEGYDYFEMAGTPPNVSVGEGKVYAFE